MDGKFLEPTPIETYNATYVGVLADFDNGEGNVTFRWHDPLYGTEGLSIDLDGHCQRCMPIRSGNGPPDIIHLDRNGIRLRFSLDLAKRLELSEEIEIRFNIDDETYDGIRGVQAYWQGE